MVRRRVTNNPSVDRGYAWVILASCFMLRMFVDSFWPSLGIIFLRWQEHFDIGASYTAWVGSMFMLVLLSTAPISSALAYRFTYRVVVITAGIVIFTCLFAISLCTSFWQISIFMPFLGIGLGITFQSGCAFFVIFFDKKLALANEINSAASAVGYLTLTPLMELMIKAYGWRGALQITSAIMAHICVCGLFLQNQPSSTVDSKNKRDKVASGTYQTPEAKNCCGKFLRDVAKSFDLSLFRNIRFVFQGIGNGLLYGANNTAIIYLIPYAVSVGIPALEASYIMLVFGISCLAIRLCPIGCIVDKKIISASTLGGIAYVICGISVVVTSFITSFNVLLIVSVVYGIALGIGGFLRMVVVTYAAGNKDKAPGAIGWMLLFEGIGTLCCILIMGVLYDLSGSYQSPLVVNGVCIICLGINMAADRCLIRYQNWSYNSKERKCTHIQNNASLSMTDQNDPQTSCTQV